MGTTKFRDGWHWALLIALVPLLGFWTYGLFDLDEGFYAAVVAEMNRRHDWITPYYNGQPWFEKPILLYWLAKPCLMTFGEAVGPRLPGILATVGLYWMCGHVMARRYGVVTARWTVLVLSSSLLFVAVGRMMMTDSLLNLSLSACLILFFLSLEGDKRLRLGSAACLGLAVLAKGPVAAILFVAITGIAYWQLPKLRTGFRGFWVPSMLVFAVVVLSWYWPCYAVNGQLFVQKFLIEQNIGRFTGGDAAHTVGFFKGLPIYPLTLLVGMAPWSFFMVRSWRREGDALDAYFKVWFLVIFVFFTISGAKLPHYILTAATPLALFIARDCASRKLSFNWGFASAAAVGLFAQFGFSYYYQQGHAEIHRLAKAIVSSPDASFPVIVYQMPRRDNDKGTGTLHLRETSHPSLLLYLNRTVAEADTPAQLNSAIEAARSAGAKGVFVLTRASRNLGRTDLQRCFEPWSDYACWSLQW